MFYSVCYEVKRSTKAGRISQFLLESEPLATGEMWYIHRVEASIALRVYTCRILRETLHCALPGLGAFFRNE